MKKETKDKVAWNHVPTKKFPTRASVERAVNAELKGSRKRKDGAA